MFFLFFCFFVFFSTLELRLMARIIWQARREPPKGFHEPLMLFFSSSFSSCVTSVACLSVLALRSSIAKKQQKKKLCNLLQTSLLQSQQKTFFPLIQNASHPMLLLTEQTPFVCVYLSLWSCHGINHSRLLLATYLCVCSHRFVSVSLFLDKRPLTAVQPSGSSLQKDVTLINFKNHQKERNP